MSSARRIEWDRTLARAAWEQSEWKRLFKQRLAAQSTPPPRPLPRLPGDLLVHIASFLPPEQGAMPMAQVWRSDGAAALRKAMLRVEWEKYKKIMLSSRWQPRSATFAAVEWITDFMKVGRRRLASYEDMAVRWLRIDTETHRVSSDVFLWWLPNLAIALLPDPLPRGGGYTHFVFFSAHDDWHFRTLLANPLHSHSRDLSILEAYDRREQEGYRYGVRPTFSDAIDMLLMDGYMSTFGLRANYPNDRHYSRADRKGWRSRAGRRAGFRQRDVDPRTRAKSESKHSKAVVY